MQFIRKLTYQIKIYLCDSVELNQRIDTRMRYQNQLSFQAILLYIHYIAYYLELYGKRFCLLNSLIIMADTISAIWYSSFWVARHLHSTLHRLPFIWIKWASITSFITSLGISISILYSWLVSSTSRAKITPSPISSTNYLYMMRRVWDSTFMESVYKCLVT